jgi:lysyl-tRNA synthetase class 2
MGKWAVMTAAHSRGFAALATALAGMATVASSLSPSAPARQRLLEAVEPDTAQSAAHVLGVLGGLATVWLALGVWHGRRPSSRAAIAVLGILAIVHLAKGLDYEEAVVGLAVAFGIHRVLAPRRGAAPSGALVGALMALTALTAAFVTTLGVLLFSGHSPRLAATTIKAGEDVFWSVPVTIRGAALTGTHLLVGVALGSLVVLLRALLAPTMPCDGHCARDHLRAARLVAEHGEDSIAPFALRADKAFHFAAGGAVAYRVVRETAVVAGDPIGPEGCTRAALESFLEHARGHGWDVVLLGATDERLADYARLGLRSMQVGLEAVVDPRRFTLEGRAAKTVRKAVHRVQRRGWTIELVTGGQLDRALAAELADVEAEWRRGRHRLYGFAMAGDRLWGAPEDASDLYAIARNPAGEARAFQRYVRYRRGLSLDAMRRLDDDPNGIADSLVAAVLERAGELGLSEVSLNFSGFGHLMAADTLERRSHRLARLALRPLHRRFQLERLARFAGKFGPVWRPRHLVYTARTRLPVAALRVLQAEAYIKPPRPARATDAWLPSPVPLATGQLVAWRR